MRGRGKTDTLDPIVAARSTLIMDIGRLRDLRAGEFQTALKLLIVGREQMNAERLRVLNAVTAQVLQSRLFSVWSADESDIGRESC